MGIPSAVPPPHHVIRLSPAAWALALSAAASGLPDDGDHSAGGRAAHVPSELDPAAVQDGWAELGREGVADGSGLVSRWREPLQEVLAPVTLLRLSAAYNGVGANSDLSITADRGVCVHRRSALEPDSDGGLRTTGHEPSLEVALFSAGSAWGAISRVLPPLDELRADAAQAGPVHGDSILQLPLTPSEAAGLGPEEAILSAAMTTRAGEGRQVWAGHWSVCGGRLYSVRTAGGALLLTPQRAGHVAREITFALAGAYQFIAGAAASA
ncbi:hypothetical protein [Arthrobacter sp. 35/47]|uniref:hypothetical protein n=1 Tax=Arthrobacter sp. 35/47 TaxID=269454 RepID=UPI00047A4741|nr:hypothetical protein [Arthrobacter sp. 35/47]